MRPRQHRVHRDRLLEVGACFVELAEPERIDTRLEFTRDLVVTGDVEAVVTLRNALDDFDGDLVREILKGLGPLTPLGTLVLQALQSTVGTKGR